MSTRTRVARCAAAAAAFARVAAQSSPLRREKVYSLSLSCSLSPATFSQQTEAAGSLIFLFSIFHMPRTQRGRRVCASSGRGCGISITIMQ